MRVLFFKSTSNSNNNIKKELDAKLDNIIFLSKDDRQHITLACEHCEDRSYHTQKNRRNTTDRLELRKYCPVCQSHQLYRETK